MEWKDATSYSHGERGSSEPRTWEITLGARIVVTRKYKLEGWYLACYELSIDSQRLQGVSAEEAQEEAIQIVFKRVDEIADAILAYRPQLEIPL